MNKKLLLLTSLAFLLVIPVVSANVAMPISWIMVPLLPIIIFVEAFIFWILAKKWLKLKIGFWKLVLVVLIANIITSLVGAFISVLTYGYGFEYSLFIVMGFIASVLIEWGLYILLFKMPLFKKVKIKNIALLKLTLFANVATYLLLAVFISP